MMLILDDSRHVSRKVSGECLETLFSIHKLTIHRFAYGPATRLARIAPNEVMVYGEYSIPAGVRFPYAFDFPTQHLQYPYYVLPHPKIGADNYIDTSRHDIRPNPPQRVHFPQLIRLHPRALDGSRQWPLAREVYGFVFQGQPWMYRYQVLFCLSS